MNTQSGQRTNRNVGSRSSPAADWSNIGFDKAFEDATSLATKIPQAAFLNRGRFPVIDQGEGFIAAYSNEESAAWSGKLPVIIFGDHTRALKFVDFPFVLGADGCKVLLPRDMIHPRFGYYHLKNLNLGAAGYSRHFKFLKESSVRFPCCPEQRWIAERLDQADRLCRTRRYALDLTDTLLPAAFLELFGDPIENPRGFEIEPLEDLIQPERPISYGILMPGPDVPGGVPYIRVTDIQDGQVMTGLVRRTTREIDHAYRRSKLKAGDLLLSIRGHVGRMAIVPECLDGANITQDTARLATVGTVEPRYLMWCLSSFGMQRRMDGLTRGAAVQGINLRDVKELPIPEPPLPLQQKFAAVVERVDRLRTVQREALRQAEHLFAALLHRAFSG